MTLGPNAVTDIAYAANKPARLDADKTAKPLTRLVGHANPNHCQGPGITVADALENVETGERISLKNLERKVRAGVAKILENQEYPVVDWQREVADGDTLLGYSDWVEYRQATYTPDEEQQGRGLNPR